MLVNGKIIKNGEKENITGLMDQFVKGFGVLIVLMEK